MSRTAEETASILTELYDENFKNDYAEPFRITWPQLRSLAAVSRLVDTYLKDINTSLSEYGQSLIPFDEFFLVARERDLEHFRMVPDRLLEQHFPDGKENAGESDDYSDDDDIEL
ncbi:MAG: hypothetical protein WCL71_08850 [Deltaproteobacteria bacterium]